MHQEYRLPAYSLYWHNEVSYSKASVYQRKVRPSEILLAHDTSVYVIIREFRDTVQKKHKKSNEVARDRGQDGSCIVLLKGLWRIHVFLKLLSKVRGFESNMLEHWQHW